MTETERAAFTDPTSVKSTEVDAMFRGSVLRKPSSMRLGWRGLVLERRNAAAGERAEEIVNHHYLVLHGSCLVGKRIDQMCSPCRRVPIPGTSTDANIGCRFSSPVIQVRSFQEQIELCPHFREHL
jgi:hypothetical protein